MKPLEFEQQKTPRHSTPPPAAGQLALFGESDSDDVGIAILVWQTEDRHRFLVGRRRDGTIALPGGHWNRGESLVGGARRELFEETGLQASGVEIASVHELYNRGAAQWAVTIGFSGVAANPDLIGAGDGGLKDLEWMTISDFGKCKDTFASDQEFVANVLANMVYRG